MQEKKTLSHAVMTAKRMIRTNIFFKPSYCVYIPSLLFVSVWIGCFPQSALRKQISAHGERSTLTAEHRSKGKRDERTPFFFKIHHALWHIVSASRKERRRTAYLTIARGEKSCSSKRFPTVAAVAALRRWSFSTSNKKKKKPSQNRRMDSRAIVAAQPVGLVPVNECTWCLVHSPQACLHQGMAARRAKLYRPATPPDRPPPLHLSVKMWANHERVAEAIIGKMEKLQKNFFLLYFFIWYL